MKVGESIHISDLPVPESVKILNFAEQSVVSITTVKAEVVEEEEIADEEEAEVEAEAEGSEE